MKFDDASWHYGGEFPEGQPIEHGGTHIGLFLKWCFIKGWAGELHADEEPDAVDAVIHGRLSGTAFLFKYCDGKFTDEDLNEAGLAFASKYYGENGLYLSDYADNFCDLMYVEPEESHDFALFCRMIECRIAAGVLNAESEED